MTHTGPAFVAYYRVSTKQQGVSGLGLEAQRAAVLAHVRRVDGILVSEFTEVESGRKANRPQLARAVAAARGLPATLVIAKLDRLARNVAFLAALMETECDFLALDLPGANRLTLHVMSAMAENEARLGSERTKAALAAAKARGTRLGNPQNLTARSRLLSAQARAAAVSNRYRMTAPLASAWRQQGWSLPRIARELNALRAPMANGGSSWTPGQVSRVLVYATR